MKTSLPFAILILLITTFSGFAQKTWTGATSTNWNTASNWNPAGVPIAAETVIIPSGPTNQPIVNGITTAVCKNLTVNSGATLTVTATSSSDATLTVHEETTFNGTLVIDGYLVPPIQKYATLVVKNIVWNSGSSITSSLRSRIHVSGNWQFSAGSSIFMNLCPVTFTGSGNSFITSLSANSRFNSLSINKSGGDEVIISVGSTANLGIDGLLTIGSGAILRGQGYMTLILKGNLNNSGNFYFPNTVVSLEKPSGTQAIQVNPGDYFYVIKINSGGTITINNDLEVKDNLVIDAGVFDPQNHTLYIGANWVNNAGPSSFVAGTGRVVFNGGNYHQHCSNENFNILEVDKPSGGLLYANDVTCQSYDWTAGGIVANVNKSFTAYDLADDGIYGTIKAMSHSVINIYQDAENTVNLNGHLEVFGHGTINVHGTGGVSYWGSWGNNASVTMNHGTINFGGSTVVISNDFTSDITGGTLRFDGHLYAFSPGFNPSGGTVKIYGTVSISEVECANGASFHNLTINKPIWPNNKVDLKNIKVNGNLDIISGSVTLLNNSTIECQGDISVNGYLMLYHESRIKLGNNSDFNVNDGGTLFISGYVDEEVLFTGLTPTDFYNISLNQGSMFYASGGKFENLGDQGLHIANGSTILSISNCIFRNGKPGAYPLISVNSDDVLIFQDFQFPEITGGNQFNIKKTNDAGMVLMLDATGPFSGDDYEHDPFNRVNWMSMHYTTPPETVSNGNAICEHAFHTLHVADLVVESGGSANLIASEKIKILPGTHIKSGGYMHAWITETFEFCEQQLSMLASGSDIEVEEKQSGENYAITNLPEKHAVLVYPNPTTDLFSIEMNGLPENSDASIQIFSIRGEILHQAGVSGSAKHIADLSGWQPGIYFVRVLSADQPFTTRIIKL